MPTNAGVVVSCLYRGEAATHTAERAGELAASNWKIGYSLLAVAYSRLPDRDEGPAGVDRSGAVQARRSQLELAETGETSDLGHDGAAGLVCERRSLLEEPGGPRGDRHCTGVGVRAHLPTRSASAGHGNLSGPVVRQPDLPVDCHAEPCTSPGWRRCCASAIVDIGSASPVLDPWASSTIVPLLTTVVPPAEGRAVVVLAW